MHFNYPLAERPLTRASSCLASLPPLEGFPPSLQCPHWPAVACALRGARLAVSLSDRVREWEDYIEIAEKLQQAITAARDLLAPLEASLIRARVATGLSALWLLGRRHAHAHAACVAYGEHVLREFCREADLGWHAGWEDYQTGEFLEPKPGDWDEAHADAAVIELERLPWQHADKWLREHFRGLRLPDPGDIITEARIEAVIWRNMTVPPAAAAGEAGQGGVVVDPPSTTRKKRQRRPRKAREPARLTARQSEALILVAEHKGNKTAAAKAAGMLRQVLTKHYHAALKKLDMTERKHLTTALPEDRRGQAAVDGDARRR